MKDLFTISEYAKATGRTRQAVYQLTDKKLSKAVKKVDGKKFLILSKLPQDEIDRIDEGRLTNSNSSVKTSVKHDSEMVELLKEQLAQKDRQIDTLTEQLTIKDRQIENYSLLLAQSQNNVKLLTEGRKAGFWQRIRSAFSGSANENGQDAES